MIIVENGGTYNVKTFKKDGSKLEIQSEPYELENKVFMTLVDTLTSNLFIF